MPGEPRRRYRLPLVEVNQNSGVSRRKPMRCGPFSLMARVTREIDLRKRYLNGIDRLVHAASVRVSCVHLGILEWPILVRQNELVGVPCRMPLMRSHKPTVSSKRKIGPP